MGGDGELPLVRRNGKSEAAFRTISEVADDLDVPQHVLRFWESKFPQVKPLKRGGGRRYYRPEDVGLLKRIRDLLYSEGYTIKGVQKLLREGGPKDAVPGGESDAASPDDGIVAAPDLSRDEDELPAIDDGEGDAIEGDSDGEILDDEEPASVSMELGQNTQVAPDVRRELTEILAELEQLRSLLNPH